ncbi:Solute carrier organic anion transporter family member [Caenorhabditis elegans]|uniref:Solute carrier organic anion transporter family member n=1 Tax=Caenorhabditis elegans TaxID=6239 RepID=Q20538_CAEEL|nr:Solute carrier organic anion transporter family member [Caenorhabditis elegans]CCD71412.1 Solute carrier organic anion transporter family member [Caenorhabditis elegans]|eukprot:NP_509531.1 Solute carrier organic anion transporter family member [Caenorhabditis elegans]
MERIYIFLGLFSFVFFLEAIGGSYINSAVQNIERQFQMSSRTSGFMISASDFGYIPCVVFIAHFGSKGNRARWIGAGAILVSITYLMLASPNFLFPQGHHDINTTEVSAKLKPTAGQLASNSTLKQLLSYQLIRDRMPHDTYMSLINLEDDTTPIEEYQPIGRPPKIGQGQSGNSTYTIDGWLFNEALVAAENLIANNTSQNTLRSSLSLFIHRRTNTSTKDIQKIRISAAAPFTFCGKLTNSLRAVIKDSKCKEQTSNSYPFLVFFFSLLLLGIGRTVPWSLGVPLLDDNIKKKSLPAYFGAISSIRVLGPICGYMIGSFCNKFYYTLNPPNGLTPADPTWIGAWWMGFLFIGSIALFPSTMLFFFPQGKEGDGSAVQLRDVHKEKLKKSVDEDRTITMKLKDFAKSCKKVLSTKIYMGSVLGRVCDVLAFKGYIVFLPKYLENHFGIPQYLVHRYMAMFGVFGFGLGVATGGYVTKKLKLNGRRAAMFVMLMSTLNVCLYSGKIFIGCESIVNSIGSNNRQTNYNFTRECNSQCSCENARLYPVCDQTGFAYFSPCHAGCREAMQYGSDPVLDFTSCQCAPGGVVSKKFCENTCKTSSVIFFLTVLPGSFVAGLGVVPAMLILLRSVPPETRSLSLGLQGMAVSLFGTLPSPILWGLVIDAACLVWDKACNGARGSCSIYHPDRLRVWMHLLYVVIRTVALITDVYVWKHAKNLNIMDEPVSEEKDNIRRNSIKMQAVQPDQ